MGEAKRRGSLEARVDEAKARAEAIRIEEARVKATALLEKRESFLALPQEEQDRILFEMEERRQKSRQLRSLLVASMATAISGKGCL